MLHYSHRAYVVNWSVCLTFRANGWLEPTKLGMDNTNVLVCSSSINCLILIVQVALRIWVFIFVCVCVCVYVFVEVRSPNKSQMFIVHIFLLLLDYNYVHVVQDLNWFWNLVQNVHGLISCGSCNNYFGISSMSICISTVRNWPIVRLLVIAFETLSTVKMFYRLNFSFVIQSWTKSWWLTSMRFDVEWCTRL